MRYLFVLALALFLAACGGAAEPQAGAVDTAVAATMAAQPAAPSATPITAPEATPIPSPTTAPAAEPTVTVLLVETTTAPELEIIVTDPLAIIAAFKTAGLEAESPTAMGPDAYGMGPFVGKGIHFLIPSLCADCGGRVFVFDNAEDLASLEAYYVEAGRSSAMLFSHVYRRGNLLVQLNGDLPAEKAAEYEAALQQVR